MSRGASTSCLSLFVSLPLIGALAACGGSKPTDAFLPPPGGNDTDGGQVTPAPSTIRLAAQGGLTTTEAGGQATFTVVLSARPTAPVVVPVTSPNEAEIKAEPTALTFGPDDWDKPKTVTLTGQNEDVDDGDQKVLVAVGPSTSTDAAWNGVRTDGIEALNRDDDVAGVEVSAPTPSATTDETSTKVTFTVCLKSRPSAAVTIGVTSSVPTEGAVDKASLVFSETDWQTPQTVTVTGQNDDVADGDKNYDVDLAKPTTMDPAYAALSASKVALTNLDDDSPGFLVYAPAPVNRFTTEAGGTAVFTVRLRSKPTANVTIPLSSTKPAEGSLEGVTQLVFTPTNYDQLQTVTVKGVDDKIDDNDQPYTITLGAATSADASYQGQNPPDVDLTNRDDDTAAILVSAPSTAITTEAGGKATFTVRLGSEPTAPVTLSLVSSKPGEGTIDKSQFVFNAANWNTPETFTVTGHDDLVDDGDQAYTIQITHRVGSVTTDAKYAAIEPADVNLTNSDDDTQGVTVTGPRGGTETTEGGAFVFIDVVLRTQPTGDVTIPVSVSNDEGAAVPTAGPTDRLVFTTANWNVVQSIRVTGKDDFVDDGDQNFTVVLGTATGGGYNVNPDDITLKNVDDDTAGLIQTALTGALTEVGGQVKFKVRLTSRPAGANSVTVPISITAGNATRSPTSLVFNGTDWDDEKEVTITGTGDGALVSTAPSVNIQVGPSTSGDASYVGRSAPGFTNVANASACGLGGTNATEGETCDDANATKCDGCESCARQTWAALGAAGTLTVPKAALVAAGSKQCVEGWMRPGATTDAAIFRSLNPLELNFTLTCKTNGSVDFSYVDSAAMPQVANAAGVACANGVFHHLSMCIDVVGTDATFTLFVDGAQAASFPAASVNTAFGDLVVGPLDGPVDELHLFKTVRSASFTPVRHATTNVNTVGLWHFNEGAGGTAASLPVNTYPLAVPGWANDTGYTAGMCN